MTPARDQGQQNSCVTFGVVSCLEFFTQNDLSEACLTHEDETQFGDCQAGADIARVMRSAKDLGCVTEQLWPYDERLVCWPNPPDVTGAQRYRFNDVWLVYDRLGDNAGDLVQLAKNVVGGMQIPVAISVPVFSTFDGDPDCGWDEGPDIHLPVNAHGANPRPAPYSHGDKWHTIAICGYDDNLQRLAFKNSWRNSYWGDQGFGTITYSYVTQYSQEAYAGTA
jgi:C1A family cysteine protease